MVNLGFWQWLTSYHYLNTLRPKQNGSHFADDIFKCIFLNENEWISLKISLKFVLKGPINNIPALVQIMAWCRPGNKPLSEPMMDNLPMHICGTLPQWVNQYSINWTSWTLNNTLRREFNQNTIIIFQETHLEMFPANCQCLFTALVCCSSNQSGTKPNLVAKFWLPNLVLYQTGNMQTYVHCSGNYSYDCQTLKEIIAFLDPSTMYICVIFKTALFMFKITLFILYSTLIWHINVFLYTLWKFIGKDPIDSDWKIMVSSGVSFLLIYIKRNYSDGLDMLSR